MKGEVVDVEPLPEEQALLSALKEVIGELEPRPDRDDPARYVWAYKHMSSSCFLPQNELDKFCSIIEKQISASY